MGIAVISDVNVISHYGYSGMRYGDHYSLQAGNASPSILLKICI